jgi:hypothetical protein
VAGLCQPQNGRTSKLVVCRNSSQSNPAPSGKAQGADDRFLGTHSMRALAPWALPPAPNLPDLPYLEPARTTIKTSLRPLFRQCSQLGFTNTSQFNSRSIARRAAELVVRVDQHLQHAHEFGPIFFRQRCQDAFLGLEHVGDGSHQERAA